MLGGRRLNDEARLAEVGLIETVSVDGRRPEQPVEGVFAAERPIAVLELHQIVQLIRRSVRTSDAFPSEAFSFQNIK